VSAPQRYRHGHQNRERAGELGHGTAAFTPLLHLAQPDVSQANADEARR
jgi:hypothetical protein